MTQYTFDPPPTVEAMQFLYDVNPIEIMDWIEQQAGDDEAPRMFPNYSQLGVECGGVNLLVDTTDYVFFCDGKIGKMSAPVFEYFFKDNTPL